MKRWARSAVAFGILLTLAGMFSKGVAAKEKANAAPKGAFDPKADKILKSMSDFLAKQKQFEVDTTNVLEVVLKSGQKLEFDSESQVSVQRPNKIRSDRRGEIAKEMSLFYDGKKITLFGKGINYFATTPAPGKIDEAIDFAREQLGIDTPASDLLYSNVYKVLTEDVVSGFYVGETQIDGIPVHHLAFRGNDSDWQIWIENANTPLPRKYVIVSKDIAGQPEYSVTLRHWNLSPGFTSDNFVFHAPTEAVQIEFANAPSKSGGKS